LRIFLFPFILFQYTITKFLVLLHATHTELKIPKIREAPLNPIPDQKAKAI